MPVFWKTINRALEIKDQVCQSVSPVPSRARVRELETRRKPRARSQEHETRERDIRYQIEKENTIKRYMDEIKKIQDTSDQLGRQVEEDGE